MKKLIVAFSLLAACVAQADLLDGLDLGGGGIGGLPGQEDSQFLFWLFDKPAVAGISWDSLALYQGEDKLTSTYQESKTYWEGQLIGANGESSALGYPVPYQTEVKDGYLAATFSLKLFKDDSEVAEAILGTGSDLSSHIGVLSFFGGPETLNITSFQAVPEPTSGLLFLVGGVLLGLRRRRQV